VEAREGEEAALDARTRSYRRNLPRYNEALGPAEKTLVVTPPFNFPGVTARVFPLRASMNILRDFCRRYLNVAPEVCVFQPHLPYVFLVVLDYGRMAVEEFNLGWVSQREVFFGVPLAMWSRDSAGRLVFEKWVLNAPFILVDNASSLTTGREVYGWPKVLATMRSSPDRWLIDPLSPTRLLTLDVKGPGSEGDVRLLDIDQQPGQNVTLIPPDLERLDPFGPLSRLTRTSLAIGYDLAQFFVGSPFSGFRPRRRDDPLGNRRAVLFESLLGLRAFLEDPGLGVVTLKQFRDTAHPAQICYQALVESLLSVARLNRCGLLGARNMLQGDVTGGVRIRLHESSAFPFVESFGLKVAQERSVRGHTVSYLEPVFPFWTSVDLTYGRGHTICWRTREEPWHVEGDPVGGARPKRAHYNTVAGGAEQVWHGPYHIPKASFDVYPLAADLKALEKFVACYFNIDPELSFTVATEPDGSAYVYMVASANRIFSQARSGACIETFQVAFYIPLLLEPRNDEDGANELRAILATPFVFVDNPVLATTMREVQGTPAVNASIEAPTQFLLREETPFQVQVDVFDALGAGLPSKRRTLLEVSTGRKIPDGTIDIKSGFYKMVMLGQFGDLYQLTLKQFRDTERPDRACYQSLVIQPWTIHLPEPAPIPLNTRVHVYRYPSFPLVDILGLETEPRPHVAADGAIADVLVPHEPFRIEMGLDIGLGKEIAHSAGSLPWKQNQPFLAELLEALVVRR
jgi:hypothetical protein